MTKLLQATFIVFLSFTIFADDHVMSSPTFVPVETQQCTFNGNKDIDDFMNLIDDWNEVLDSNEEYSYSGWVLTPQYRTESDFSFDFAWLGVSNNWSEFGGIYDVWLKEAGPLAAKFDKIRTCKTQTLFAGQTIRPAKESSDSGGVLLISNCTLSEGATLMDLAAADAKLNLYLDSINSEGGIYRWFPGLGSPSDASYTFKNVQSASSMLAWGKSSETFVNGGGLATQSSIYGEIVSCDSARMYFSNNVRDVRN